MVPCSRMGEEGKGRGGGTLSCRGRIKEQVRVERKRQEEEARELSSCCLSLGPHASPSKDSVYMHTVVEGLVRKSALLKFKVTLTESLNYIN